MCLLLCFKGCLVDFGVFLVGISAYLVKGMCLQMCCDVKLFNLKFDTKYADACLISLFFRSC